MTTIQGGPSNPHQGAMEADGEDQSTDILGEAGRGGSQNQDLAAVHEKADDDKRCSRPMGNIEREPS